MGLKRILVIIAYLLTTILLLDKTISKESPSEEFIVRGWGREEGSEKINEVVVHNGKKSANYVGRRLHAWALKFSPID